MTPAAEDSPPSTRLVQAAPAVAPSPLEIASRLAARLCHDFMSPASGIVSGLDLLADPTSKDLHADAQQLIANSAGKLVDLLTFARAAFGPAGDIVDTRELETLARGAVAHGRAGLQWNIAPCELPPLAGQALLNLVQIASAALPAGGQVRVSARAELGWSTLLVEAVGERSRLHEEVRAGLAGEALGEGLAGRWIQAWCLNALVAGARGALAAEPGAAGVTFRLAVPA